MKNTLITTSILISGALAFVACGNSKVSNTDATETTTENEVNYLETGKELAMQTKSSLGKYLVQALGEKGPEGAVEFCNTKAIPITDSMSLALSATIKRVSDQPRNPDNQANEAELSYINHWKEATQKGEKSTPQLSEIDGQMVGYYPIITNQMCLQCHGQPEQEITSGTLAAINKLYPSDQATGYSSDEIRGIFVVEMSKAN